MDLRKVIGTLGVVVFVLAVFMSTSLPWVWFDEGRAGLRPWAVAIGLTGGIGLLLALWGRPRKERWRRRRGVLHADEGQEFSRREALAVVALSWILCGLFGALPLLLSGMVDSPVDAFFESVSGVTTTGSTILTDIEASSRGALWWRSLMQWLGGMGIIVFFLAIFPQAGGSGRKLFEGEVPGPEKEQLRPRIAETSAILWRIYGGLTAVACLLYYLAGMTLFDAICHAFTTLASGGFSTKNLSIASFNSPLIEATATVFMLLAGVNFALYFGLLRRRTLKPLRDPELIFFLSGLAIAIGLLTFTLLPTYSGNLLEAFRYASFQTVSIATSTGYGTADFALWPPFTHILLLTLMFVGGMAGSTSGGFKISRIMIILNQLAQELRRAIHPRGVFTTRIGGRPIPDHVVRAVLTLLALNVLTLSVGSALMTLLGLPAEEAISATLTAFANGGPGLGSVGPGGHFGAIPDAAKILMALLMVVGRLEFFTAFALLTRGFWTGR